MDWLIAFLSKHFEVIVAVQVYYMIGMAVIIVFLQVRHVRLKHIHYFLRDILYYLVVIGETVLLMSIIYVFSLNSAPKPALDFSYRILPSTEWVKDKMTIYFIADKELVTIEPNGADRKVVFKANDRIRAYQFSPNGKNILIVTETQLYLYSLESKTRELIESLDLAIDSPEEIKGSIGQVRFSPDGSKFCYRTAKWSNYSSQENWFVYDVAKKEKKPIVSPTLALGSLLWDKKGENLYYPWFETLNPSIDANPYRVKLYKVSLETLKPELVMQFGFDKPQLTPDHLEIRDIHLDFSVDQLSFGRDAKVEYTSRAPTGELISIDEHDMLYYVPHRWWRKRLYQIPRVPIESDMERYQYQGGQLAVQHLRWLPSGRYVIMEHNFWGILILDPQTGKLGILDNQRGETFGWY